MPGPAHTHPPWRPLPTGPNFPRAASSHLPRSLLAACGQPGSRTWGGAWAVLEMGLQDTPAGGPGLQLSGTGLREGSEVARIIPACRPQPCCGDAPPVRAGGVAGPASSLSFVCPLHAWTRGGSGTVRVGESGHCVLLAASRGRCSRTPAPALSPPSRVAPALAAGPRHGTGRRNKGVATRRVPRSLRVGCVEPEAEGPSARSLGWSAGHVPCDHACPGARGSLQGGLATRVAGVR